MHCGHGFGCRNFFRVEFSHACGFQSGRSRNNGLGGISSIRRLDEQLPSSGSSVIVARDGEGCGVKGTNTTRHYDGARGSCCAVTVNRCGLVQSSYQSEPVRSVYDVKFLFMLTSRACRVPHPLWCLVVRGCSIVLEASCRSVPHPRD